MVAPNASLTRSQITVDGTAVDGAALVSSFTLAEGEAMLNVRVQVDDSGQGASLREATSSGEACFIVNIKNSADEKIASHGAVLPQAWMQRPLLKAAIEPALRASGLLDQGGDASHMIYRIGVEGVSAEGKMPDGTDVGLKTKAGTLAAATANPSGGVCVEVVLRAAFDPLYVEVDIVSADSRELLSETDTVLHGKQLDKPLITTLVRPALAAAGVVSRATGASLAEADSDGSLVSSAVSATVDAAIALVTFNGRKGAGTKPDELADLEVSVNGEPISDEDLVRSKASSVVPSGTSPTKPMKLVIAVPGSATLIDRLPRQFAILFMHEKQEVGRVSVDLPVNGLGTLHKPLDTAFILPAIEQHIRHYNHHGFVAANFHTFSTQVKAKAFPPHHGIVVINDKAVDMHQSIASLIPQLIGAAGASEHETEIVVNLPTGNLRAPSTAAPFALTITGPNEADALAPAEKINLETTMSGAYLDKTLLAGLIDPALEQLRLGPSNSVRLGADFVKTIEVDGKLVDGHAPATNFARPYGSSAAVTVTVSSLPSSAKYDAFFSQADVPAHAHFQIDIYLQGNANGIQLESSIPKNSLLLPLTRGVVGPAISSSGEDCVIAALMEGATISVDGAVVDGKALGASYLRSAQAASAQATPGSSVHVAIFLHGSAGFIASKSVPVTEADLKGIADAAPPGPSRLSSAGSGLVRRMASFSGNERASHGGSPPSAPTHGKLFHVDIEATVASVSSGDWHTPSADGSAEPWSSQFETRLNARWVKKSLTDAIITPAMDVYYANDVFTSLPAHRQRPVPMASILVTVNDRELSEEACGVMPADFFVFSDPAKPVEISLKFEQR